MDLNAPTTPNPLHPPSTLGYPHAGPYGNPAAANSLMASYHAMAAAGHVPPVAHHAHFLSSAAAAAALSHASGGGGAGSGLAPPPTSVAAALAPYSAMLSAGHQNPNSYAAHPSIYQHLSPHV